MTQTSHSSPKIPKLRFREFQGEWIKKTMGDFTKVNQGLQIPISDRFTEPAENSSFYITNEFLKVGNQKKYYIKNPPSSVLCNEDDILMTRTGNTGKIVTGVSGAFHNNFFKIQYSKSDYDRIFLCEFLGLDKTQNEILKVAGTSTIPDLNHSDFYKLKINLPSFPEQQKIASFFSSVDTRIEQLREKKSLLEEYKRGVMQKIFAREIRFKDENGKEYGEWEEKRLGDYCDLKNGYAFKSSTYEEDGKYRIITIANVQDGYLELGSGNSIIELPKDIKEHQKLQLGDLLISMTGNVGRVCIVTEENLLLNQRVGKLVFRDCEKNYIFQLLRTKTFLDGMIMCAQGGAQPNLSKDDILGFPIIIPSDIKEQQKIASFLSEIDSKIQSTTEQLEEAEKWKKGLLQAMFV